MRRTIEVRGAACSVLVEIEWAAGGDETRLTASVGDEVVEVCAPDAPTGFVHRRAVDRSGSPPSRPAHRLTLVDPPVAGVLAARAPLPGLVADILVAPGDRVRRGQPLLVLEAMKMQNPVAATEDGRVRVVSVRRGEQVQQGQVLVQTG